MPVNETKSIVQWSSLLSSMDAKCGPCITNRLRNWKSFTCRLLIPYLESHYWITSPTFKFGMMRTQPATNQISSQHKPNKLAASSTWSKIARYQSWPKKWYKGSSKINLHWWKIKSFWCAIVHQASAKKLTTQRE